MYTYIILVFCFLFICILTYVSIKFVKYYTFISRQQQFLLDFFDVFNLLLSNYTQRRVDKLNDLLFQKSIFKSWTIPKLLKWILFYKNICYLNYDNTLYSQFDRDREQLKWTNNIDYTLSYYQKKYKYRYQNGQLYFSY